MGVGGVIDFDGYRRRLDCFEYQSRRHDVPRDIAQLLAIAYDLEQVERNDSIDDTQYPE